MAYSTTRFLAMIGLLLAFVCRVSAESHLFGWKENANLRTGEKEISFFVSPADLSKLLEADARGDAKTAAKLAKELPENLWAYGILLKGTGDIYRRANIGVIRFRDHESVEIGDGFVKIDWKTATVLVALKFERDGKTQDFEGNGRYEIKQPSTGPKIGGQAL